MVSNIIGRVDAFEVNKIMLNPFTECTVFDINMSSPCCGLLGIAHGGISIIVLMFNGGGLLGNIKIP